MNYIIGPKMDKKGMFAGNKFPRDIIDICNELGFKKVYVHEGYNQKKLFFQYLEDYINLLHIENNSTVIYIDQVTSRLSRKLVYKVLTKKNAKIIPLLEDIDILRRPRRLSQKNRQELECLNLATCIISQNHNMSKFLKNSGVEKPTVEMNVLDFLTNSTIKDVMSHYSNDVICYGGNLSYKQSGFLTKLKSQDIGKLQYYVYGKGEVSNKLPHNVIYKGGFSAEESIEKLKGDWGLVWNGSSVNINDKDANAKYYNFVSPHKFSMYALCGMPVIVYSKSAMAEFVKENECGILINNLSEIPQKISSISKNQYIKYRRNISKVAVHISKGNFTKKAIRKAELLVNNIDNNFD
ncbi:beta-1,6-galactofuranosyltransferase [Limosilactobacillus allomucosae]|uniref:Beta-1,6-galactofuranosyltransferase n=1 Tax=Limosilactobacillus allomucosae TaxID=3142938 RepID=A0ABV0I1S6_9LACO